MTAKTDPFIQLLLARLERISVDSPLAHRASGVRGSLMRVVEKQQGGQSVDPSLVSRSISAALAILHQAAAAIEVDEAPDPKPKSN